MLQGFGFWSQSGKVGNNQRRGLIFLKHLPFGELRLRSERTLLDGLTDAHLDLSRGTFSENFLVLEDAVLLFESPQVAVELEGGVD